MIECKMKSTDIAKLRAKAKLLMNQAHKASLESVRLQGHSAKLVAEAKRLLREAEKMTHDTKTPRS